MKKETGKQVSKTDNKPLSGNLIGDIRRFIETARQNVAVTVNAGLTILYWQIDSRIRQDILKEKRAEYGREIVVTLSRQLVKEFGNGFSAPISFGESEDSIHIIAFFILEIGILSLELLTCLKLRAKSW